MKKIYHLLMICVALPFFSAAQSSVQDTHNLVAAMQGPGGNSPQFYNDVVVAPSSMREHGTSLAVAFNGWVYEATGFETMDSDSSGGIVRYSKDNGFTWNNFATWLYPNVDYINPEIEVAGTDTNNLSVFIAGAWYDSTSGAADIWVDKYNGRNGQFISEVYNESMQYPVRDLDIATDYRYPSFGASPYTVGLLYSHLGTQDSIIFVSSVDAGTTWSNRTHVAGTGAYFDQVSLAFGVSSNYWVGRYFAVWEERSSFTATTIGKIKTSHCLSAFNSAWSQPFCLDSLDIYSAGFARRPRIACQYNSFVNNDSLGLSTAVIFERAYNGDTADCDILGFCSWSQPSADHWYRFDVDNNNSQALEPDISYDPANNNFLLTYFNRTAQDMPYLVHDFTLNTFSTWNTITVNYCDQPNTVRNPFPRVAINPALTLAAFSWTRMATPNREQAMFDAEYIVTAVPVAVTPEMPMNLYPNPANDYALLSFDLASQEKVRIDIFDLSGNLVMNLVDESMSAGPQQISISSSALAEGTYLVSLATNEGRYTSRLVVAK